MGFWGLEVKPGEHHPYHPDHDNVQGQLHVTQATLGSGLGKDKSVLQCSAGDKGPIYLCSLLPDKTECCPLSLVFDDNDEPVEFTVIGERSIHLSGYFEDFEQNSFQGEDDSDGIDIAETDSDESSDYDSEEDCDSEEDFIDDDDDIAMHQPSSVPNSGVVIEEIEDEESPVKEVQPKRHTKKSQSKSSEDKDAKKQTIVKDSDRFTGQDGVLESDNKNKKKKKQKQKQGGENANGSKDEQAQKEETPETNQVSSDKNENSKSLNNSAEKKKKNKNKNKNQEADGTADKAVSSNQEKEKSDSVSEGNKGNSKTSHVQTHPNGLIVEELVMGKPDGKRASPGKQVSVRYIGKLQKNGKIFDSNVRKAPFKFRLGLGQVIKGWDVGVNGMRVGEKRRLTIPPSMGYGKKGAGGQIPPNAWLVFDVELIDVC
ncbi:PREDICTED: peptidyl-prolyl cis-trans isomerase FKBP53-like [Tarenaya hassleriana]|uniref:peptidyl-prolyl cis-trans isomerase FKBP53-like n=1 Tax=Tarenaya hassleriana TaxID=28532 RepID=UPI00053C474B|nr:PREDICTED: peptidyl-prolyl cis-trans isomerase FKBP53-like [Tarenaya hassleriana]